MLGTVISVVYPLLAKMKLVAEGAGKTFKFGSGATSVSTGLSMALIGAAILLMVVTFTALTLAIGGPIYDKIGELGCVALERHVRSDPS